MIEIRRGDTKGYKFCRRDTNHEILLGKPSDVYFTVKTDSYIDKPVFQKRLSDGSITFDDEGYYHFEILPEDTNNIDYGRYVFDVEVRIDYDNYTRTLTKDDFIVKDEVTFASNEV